MKTCIRTFLFCLLLFLVVCFKQTIVSIKGWIKTGSKPESYRIGLDSSVYKRGQKSLFIESLDNNIEGFATVMQVCNARDFLGTKIKMTGYLRSENLKDWAGMWLRFDSRTEPKSISFENMQDRPILGTSDWTRCEIILDVPAESGTMNFGVLISGTGKIWFDNLSFEVVDTLTRQVNRDFKFKDLNAKPVNLDFEE